MTNKDKLKSQRYRKPSGLALKLKDFFNRVNGNPVETDLSHYQRIVEKIKAGHFEQFTDKELKARSERLITRARSWHSTIGEYAPWFALESQSSRIPRKHKPLVAECESMPSSIKRGREADEICQTLEEGRRSASPSKLIQNILVEAFSLVREASPRTIGLAPFDCQVIAGLAMSQGKIAELPTGEGKTLAAVFPAYLHALSGQGVHILTFNDYLARRDAAWMGPIYEFLGLRVGCIQEGLSVPDKRAAYTCDVTYATAKEAGFDFLRDQICYRREDKVHRPFHMALVDEADSILIDEARIPLIISGVEEKAAWDTMRLAKLVKTLVPGIDYETDAEYRNVFLTDKGSERLEKLLGCNSLFDPQNQLQLEDVYCALHAEALLRKDVDYIVRNGKIEIVDEFTGRVVHNRLWPDGLQAAVEAKEDLYRKSEGRVLGSITLQHFFKLYPKLCGMTATARPAAAELKEFYGMQVVVVPPNKPSIRVDHPDEVFTHSEAKLQALVREICEVHSIGRPVLVGTASVKESEGLAGELRKTGIFCNVLNAKNDELEARIVAQAGMLGAVTISTNMAGRGTDIKLGGADEKERDRVVELGGLYVIGTNRHESLRIDHQLRGRAGRQGDPGSTRFFISLEDDLFERYGLSKKLFNRHHLELQSEALKRGPIHKEIKHAQRIIEGQNFDIRKTLWKYSSLIETQRRIIQDWRERAFNPDEPVELLSQKVPELYAAGVARFGKTQAEQLERRLILSHIDRCWSDHLAWTTDTRESIHLVSLAGMTPLQEFHKSATETFLKIQPKVKDAVIAEFEKLIKKEGPLSLDAEGMKGPSSTWTYLVNEDQFGWGVEMLKGRNIGLSAAAAVFTGPLYIITLLLNRIFKKKK